jgi:CrcB protein
MIKLLCIFVGSGLGGLLRYAMQGWVHRATGVSFPAGTLVVNVLGCLVIGFLTALVTGPVLMREEYRIGLTVGLLGGFTTFSTFGLETFALANEGQIWWAVLNVVLSCGCGLIAVWFGYRVAENVFGA